MTGITNSQSKIQMPKNPSTRYRNFKICMYQKKKKKKLQNMKPFRKNTIKGANIQYMKTNIKTCYRNISDHIEDSEIERER